MSQMLIQRMTRHWRNEYSWIPSDPTWFAGYTNWSSSGTTKDHAHHGHGVPFAAVFEIAGRWWLQLEVSAYNLEHRQSAVNSLVNWLLVNLREIIRRG